MRSWDRFCALLAQVFVVRGLVLLCFFPPLEGPDEYQHIACLAFVHERGSVPVLVAICVLAAILLRQVRATGGRECLTAVSQSITGR